MGNEIEHENMNDNESLSETIVGTNKREHIGYAFSVMGGLFLFWFIFRFLRDWNDGTIIENILDFIILTGIIMYNFWMGFLYLADLKVQISHEKIEFTWTAFSSLSHRKEICPDTIFRINVWRKDSDPIHPRGRIWSITIQLEQMWRMIIISLDKNHFTEEQLLRIEKILKEDPMVREKMIEKIAGKKISGG
jgi:hypothetical protein